MQTVSKKTPATTTPAPIVALAIITPVDALKREIVEIETLLAVATTRASVRAALETELSDARGALALASAQAALDAERNASIAEARLSVASITNPERRERMLDMALALIDAEYAPVAPEVTPEPTAPEVTEAHPSQRGTSARTQAINADAASDSAAHGVARSDSGYWDKSADAAACLSRRDSGTRYPSFVPLASNGTGVANYAELQKRTAAVRHVYRLAGVRGVGNSTVDAEWLARRDRFSPTGAKSNEYASKCFTDGRTVALYADGQFRFATRNTPGVRFIDADASAWSQFRGKAGAPASPAPQTVKGQAEALADATADATAPRKRPTPPNVQASASGHLTKMGACQHDGRRNPIGASACVECGAADWDASA
jgi:hypothetical protein